MSAHAAAALLCLLAAPPAAGLSATRLIRAPPALIPRTAVPMPPDYADFARGQRPWRLFPGRAPSERASRPAPGVGLPAFDADDPEQSPEVFMEALPTDPVCQKCAPGGWCAGHTFYNVWDPELVPFIVNRSRPDFVDAAVVVAPGGGDATLSWEPEGLAQAQWLNGMGVSAFVLKYRVPDRSGQLGLIDAQRAIALVRARAEGLGLRADRVGFMGFSAGGMHALQVGTEVNRAYPPVDEHDRLRAQPDFVLAIYPQIPWHFSHPEDLKSVPATFLAYTRDDPCCLALLTQPFVAVLNKTSSSPVVAVEYETGKHGWGSCDYYPFVRDEPACGWHAPAEAFLRGTVLGL